MQKKVKLEGPWPNSVTKKDLEITWFNGSGCGGQNRNKNANCCRMKHIPTGTMSQAQEFKSREQNQRAAFRRLADQLVPIMKELLRTDVPTEYKTCKEVIRTYKEKPNLVIDKRIDKRFKMSEIMEGNLEELHN